MLSTTSAVLDTSNSKARLPSPGDPVRAIRPKLLLMPFHTVQTLKDCSRGTLWLGCNLRATSPWYFFKGYKGNLRPYGVNFKAPNIKIKA